MISLDLVPVDLSNYFFEDLVSSYFYGKDAYDSSLISFTRESCCSLDFFNLSIS